MPFTDLNTAILTEYASNTGSYADALRAEVPAIYLEEAPPATPYPLIVFEDISSSTEYTWCTLLETCPIDFIAYGDTKDEVLQLSYNLKKLYDGNTLPLSGGYENIGAIYTGQFSDYDTTDNKFFCRSSINYTIASPDVGYSPITPDIIAAREFTFDILVPTEYEEVASVLIGNDVTLNDGKATALTAGTAETIFIVYRGAVAIGTVTFAIGSTVGAVDITSTDFIAGDKLGVFSAVPAVDLEGVDITITGTGY